jgi:CelD/BcsL family acetyltransferase involved in cellulose biosynthesis
MPEDTVSQEQITFEIVRDEGAMAQLRDDWQRLWEGRTGAYYLPSFDVLAETFASIHAPEGKRLFVVVGRVGPRVVLICPIVLGRHKFWRTATWLSRDPIDYGDVLVEPSPQAQDWIDAAMRHLLTTVRCDLVILNAVRDDAAVAPIVRRHFPVQIEDNPAPFIDFGRHADWKSFEANLQRNFRRQLNRRMRRLDEAGEVRFTFEHQSEALEDTVQWIVERKREWIKERDLTNELGVSDDHAAMFVRLLKNPDRPENALIARLTLDGELIAADIGILVGKRFYSDLGTFDLKWGKFSPGALLLRETIKWALENGYEIFDLGRGNDDYKVIWSDDQVKLNRYMKAQTLFGRIYTLMRTMLARFTKD